MIRVWHVLPLVPRPLALLKTVCLVPRVSVTVDQFQWADPSSTGHLSTSLVTLGVSLCVWVRSYILSKDSRVVIGRGQEGPTTPCSHRPNTSHKAHCESLQSGPGICVLTSLRKAGKRNVALPTFSCPFGIGIGRI